MVNSFKYQIITLLTILLIIAFTACNSRPNNVLSKNKMISALTDIHTLEGALEASGKYYNEDDKTLYFNAVFEKYNTTRADFDSSLIWYTSHPRDFERIYNAVTENLKTLETDVKNYKYHPFYYESLTHSKSELWTHADTVIVTPDTSFAVARFVVKHTTLQWQDIYKLTFIERVWAADTTENFYAVTRIHYHNGLIDSVKIDLKTDSVKRRFRVQFPAKERAKIDSITANLFVYDYTGEKYKAQIDSIKLIREYNSLIQDSIGKLINDTDTISPIKR
ncbi:MAG: DUF4296 domain-containing protein [Paludibacter sp.]|jgi:hypothetical protein|nr:DUF4296 domain-containing protein [Paludibacter sp.]